MDIKTLELNDGEFVGIAAMEITSIPTLSILKDSYPQGADIEAEYRQGFSNLLIEFYQGYRTFCSRDENAEISVELMWVTEPVKNQPFKAKINLFMVLRAVARDKKTAASMVGRLMSSCGSMLKLYQYGTKNMDTDVLNKKIGDIPIQSIEAVVKDERMENLQNQLLPECYVFDRFNGCAHDLGALVNCLIDHPQCVFSVQLIPTQLSVEENSAITQLTPILDTLSNGVMAQGVGNVSFSNVDALAETYRYYQSSRNNALFTYNFLIFGSRSAVNDLSSKLHGTLAYDSSKPTALKHVYFSNSTIQITNNFVPLPWVINELLIQTDRNTCVWYQSSEFTNFYRSYLGFRLVRKD